MILRKNVLNLAYLYTKTKYYVMTYRKAFTYSFYLRFYTLKVIFPIILKRKVIKAWVNYETKHLLNDLKTFRLTMKFTNYVLGAYCSPLLISTQQRQRKMTLIYRIVIREGRIHS